MKKLLLVLFFTMFLVLAHGATYYVAHGAACAPANYTHITNSAPLPDDFCAYAYLPFRSRLPDNPQHIDQTNTTIFQNEYAPNSMPGTVNAGIGQLMTIGVKPTGAPQGNSGYPIFIASPNDPLVSVNCARVAHGCSDSDGHGNLSSVPSFRIPTWARPSSQFNRWSNVYGDSNMEIIQPDGSTALIYQCFPLRDWQNGDVLGDNTCDGFGSGSPISGFATGNIVTSAGVNPGNLNGGDNFATLLVHYREVMNGQINHALVVWAGCFTGAVYPSPFQALGCQTPPGIPAGARIWLSLTRSQIDAQPTSVIPAHMRVFAYAAHEYGMYTLDTGNGQKWISNPGLEEGLPYLLSGAGTTSFWTDWFVQNGGGMSGDANLKLQNTIDWRGLAPYLFVLDACYAQGTCSDSVPEAPSSPALPGPTNLRLMGIR